MNVPQPTSQIPHWDAFFNQPPDVFHNCEGHIGLYPLSLFCDVVITGNYQVICSPQKKVYWKLKNYHPLHATDTQAIIADS